MSTYNIRFKGVVSLNAESEDDAERRFKQLMDRIYYLMEDISIEKEEPKDQPTEGAPQLTKDEHTKLMRECWDGVR